MSPSDVLAILSFEKKFKKSDHINVEVQFNLLKDGCKWHKFAFPGDLNLDRLFKLVGASFPVPNSVTLR